MSYLGPVLAHHQGKGLLRTMSNVLWVRRLAGRGTILGLYGLWRLLPTSSWVVLSWLGTLVTMCSAQFSVKAWKVSRAPASLQLCPSSALSPWASSAQLCFSTKGTLGFICSPVVAEPLFSSRELGNDRALLNCLPSLRDHYPSLSDVQCLKNHFFIHCILFLFFSCCRWEDKSVSCYSILARSKCIKTRGLEWRYKVSRNIHWCGGGGAESIAQW